MSEVITSASAASDVAASDVTASGVTVPLDEIQSGIFDPTVITFETHLFLGVADAVAGRAFVRSLIGRVTTEASIPSDPLAAAAQTRVNVGFTWSGLAAVGVSAEVLASFPQEFRDGMVARGVILGDDPSHSGWDPVYLPPTAGGTGLHVWVLVQAPDTATLAAEVEVIRSLALANDVSVIGTEQGAQFGAEHGSAKEHFGFNDNLSQPGVAGVGQPVYPGQGGYQPDGTWAPIPVGCFLLGHADGYGEIASRPSDPALRTNGTYMVLRKLEQDVAGFRSYVSQTAHRLGMDEEHCAAKFVGRWRSGAPLELAPDHDDPSILVDPNTANAFTYRAPCGPTSAHDGGPASATAKGGDLDGDRVPRRAHIRRVNPRDSLAVDSVVDPANHRIIRRSAPYGPYLDRAADDGQRRGLLFRAFNASILDQFEMIQSEWVNNGNEANGLSTDRDPFVGADSSSTSPSPEGPLGASFTIPQPDGSCPTIHNLPQFVTPRGGAYLFVPSLSGLSRLCVDPVVARPAPPPTLPAGTTFIALYESIKAAPGNPPEAVLQEQIDVVMLYQQHLVELGNELRAADSTKIFPTSIGVLLGTAADMTEVFTRGDVFSVCGYGERLIDLTGPFILGMDAGPQYDRESSIMRFVTPGSDLQALEPWIEGLAASLVATAVSQSGTPFDLVSTVAVPAPLRFVGHYFGVPGPDDETFMAWLRAIGISVFEWWSAFFPSIKDVTTSISPAFEAYLDGLIRQRSADIAAGTTVPDDVLTRLLSLPGVDSPTHPMALDRLGIRRNLGGFAVGSSVALSTAIVSAVQYLLDPANAGALQATQAASRARDAALVRQCMLEAARLGDPSPPSVFRTALTDAVLAKGTLRETKIPRGSIIVLNPTIAMTDPDAVPDPLTFRTDRPAGTYMMFGEGMHTCFGTAIATMILGAVGQALFALDDLHEVSPMQPGVGIPGEFYPGSYLLASGHI